MQDATANELKAFSANPELASLTSSVGKRLVSTCSSPTAGSLLCHQQTSAGFAWQPALSKSMLAQAFTAAEFPGLWCFGTTVANAACTSFNQPQSI
jgi:hypothetical protein